MADTRDDDEFAGYTPPGFDPLARDNQRRPDSEDGRPADVSGWYERTPSGWRDRVDAGIAKKLAYREFSEQRIEQHDRNVRKFESAQFVGHVTDKLTFTKHGDVIVQFIVPFQFKDLAMGLSDAFGLPLHVDVQLWKPYQDRIDQAS